MSVRCFWWEKETKLYHLYGLLRPCTIFHGCEWFSSISKRTALETAEPLMHVKRFASGCCCAPTKTPCAIFKLFAKLFVH